ncbi:putative Cytochrome P450 3A24, partial [Hypsibius exemplaris]
MNGLINECCDILIANLGKKADSGEEFECQGLFRTVTMDVIASTFFGTKIDSQNDPNNAFTKNATEAFNFTALNPALITYLFFPWALPLVKKFDVQFINKKYIDFFVENTKEIIKMRTESNVVRKDFLQLMLNSMQGTGKNSERKLAEPVADLAVDTDESQDADIISHHLSEGSFQEKPL